MARPGRTQKQIAERYKGNLGYYRKLHPWRRARLIVSVATLFAGLVAIWIYRNVGSENFFSAGPLSENHAAFAHNCEACHDASLVKGGLTMAKFKEVVRNRFREGLSYEHIDRKCQSCHQQHTFHAPNVVEDRSCSACHQEHQGPARMAAVTSSHCASCHADSATMQASAAKAVPAHWTPLHRHPQPAQRVVFDVPRPARGYTQTFSSFWKDHPEFQIHVAKAANPIQVRDPNVLRFNHQRHFASDIPAVDKTGKKLDCNYCHQVETEGRFMKRVSFEANCQACHSLQFDLKNPKLHLPHGDSTAVLGFLRSLPTQYEELARTQGMTNPAQVRSFVAQQRGGLRAQFNSDEELIRSVFFTGDPFKPQQRMDAAARAHFTGCAFCHEVKPSRVGAPTVTKPILIDRWILQSDFNHSKHASVRCDDCHHAAQSRETSDILMPVKADCIKCHSPKGEVAQVSSECITCHQFHVPPAVQATAGTSRPGSGAAMSVKEMLLGGSGGGAPVPGSP